MSVAIAPDPIRTLNDEFRKALTGGMVVLTAGVIALDREAQQRILRAVAEFNSFEEGNDPYGEHDFGSLECEGERLFFKIDYYDLELSAHSPDPADPSVTKRVMTIMLAEEY